MRFGSAWYGAQAVFLARAGAVWPAFVFVDGVVVLAACLEHLVNVACGQVLAFMTAGGLIYTGGVVLYKSKRPYSTAAWHGCVLVASACFWFAILIGTLAGVELR